MILKGETPPEPAVFDEKIDFTVKTPTKTFHLKENDYSSTAKFSKHKNPKITKSSATDDENDKIINRIFSNNNKTNVSNYDKKVNKNEKYFENKFPFISEKTNFSDFLTQSQLLRNLIGLGFAKPTHIQQRAAARIMDPEIRTVVIGAEVKI